MKNILSCIVSLMFCVVAFALPQRPNKAEVLKLIGLTNNYWQDHNPSHGNYFWNRAVYHVGNMEAYRTTGNEEYLKFSKAWGERNNWSGAKDQYNWMNPSAGPTNWIYSYGENNVLFGDCQICFQVYSEIYDVDKNEHYLERAKQVMGYEIESEPEDYLWWADGLFMVMPVMTHMYHQTGNVKYLNKMYAYWRYAVDLMWDTEEHLFYRDGSYVYPKAQTVAGGKDFWARGDGWVMAALARVLKDFDTYVDTDNNPSLKAQKQEYAEYFKMMADALKAAQQPEGHWSRSILDVNQAPGYESTGTELMLYGYLWGVNNGYFNEEDYAETIDKAWRYLTDVAVHYDGKVGYMQPIGSSASPGTYVGADSQADFGMGGFLLASSEMYRFATDNGYHRTLILKNVKANSAKEIEMTFNMDVDAANTTTAMFTIDGDAVEGRVEVKNNVVTLSLNKELSYATTHIVEINGLQSTDGGSVAEGCLAEFYVDVPIEKEQYYVIKHNASGLYMNFNNAQQKVLLLENGTNMRFVPAENGEMYLTNGTDYVGMAGTNRWTMSSLEENAVTWTLTGLGDGLYTINGTNGCIGTDNIVEGSDCYGDKSVSAKNSYWFIVPVLMNMDFDNEESFMDNHIITYQKDLAQHQTTLCHQQPVDGWVRSADDVDGKAAGVFAYGTNAYLAASGNYVPASDIDGNTDGGVLGLAACWKQSVQYTQQVELEAGSYTMTYDYYNVAGTNSVAKNLFGVFTDDGREFISNITKYDETTWHTDTIAFTLDTDSRITISLGYVSEDCGSGASPKLFIDNVSINSDINTGVSPVRMTTDDDATYDLMGVRVEKMMPHHIYIRKGKLIRY